MPSDDGNIDYSGFTRAELLDAVRNINPRRFPKNYENLVKALETPDIDEPAGPDEELPPAPPKPIADQPAFTVAPNLAPDEIVRRHRANRRRVNLVSLATLPFFAPYLYLVWQGKDELLGQPKETWMYVLIVAFVIELVHSVASLRCPNCRKFLVKTRDTERCKSCNVSLTD